MLPKDNEANFLNYGHSLSLEDKPFLYDISCKKGIDEYEMYLYYKSDTYEMKYRKNIGRQQCKRNSDGTKNETYQFGIDNC